jgi:hypothetical protein
LPLSHADAKTGPQNRSSLVAIVSEPAEPTSQDTSLLHLSEGRDSHARAADALSRHVEVLHDLDHGGGAELGGLDRRVRVVVKLIQRDGQGDLLLAEDEAIGQGLGELGEELGAVGSGRAKAGDELVVGTGAAANLDLVLALAGCHSEGLGNDILVDGGLTGRDRGRGAGGEEGNEGYGVHYKGGTSMSMYVMCMYVCIYIQGGSGRVLPRIGK